MGKMGGLGGVEMIFKGIKNMRLWWGWVQYTRCCRAGYAFQEKCVRRATSLKCAASAATGICEISRIFHSKNNRPFEF